MRHDEVSSRLARLPSRPPPAGVLPPPPDWLRPVPIDGSSLPERPPPGSGVRRAAALLCLFPDAAGEVRVVMTERIDHGGHHSGEVSLPGGKTEPGEIDPVETALREAREEVGLDPAACGLVVLGFLEPTWIPASSFLVTPVVGLAERAPALRADPGEVSAIFDARLEAFLPDAPRAILERSIRGRSLRHGAYLVEGRIVWGATARMLAQLGALLAATPD